MPSSCCSKQLVRGTLPLHMGAGRNKMCFRMTASNLLSSLSEAKDSLGVRQVLVGLHNKRPYVCLAQRGAGCIYGVEMLWFHHLLGSSNLLILLNLPLPIQLIWPYQVQYGGKSYGSYSAVSRKILALGFLNQFLKMLGQTQSSSFV